ncbi:recombinase family protein [Caulobacter sp. DWR1-3-2b1]|uniref:recombinase family protein n=1 Tax=Caulobacter sp. DWR1-3-2b1 TaxID=2804670 RepID=UPI003CECE47B
MNLVGYYRLPPVRGVFFSPAQEERLLFLGCQEVFSDRCLAGGVVRPGLERALAALEPGGTLAVPSFHALAGAMVDLLDIVLRLKARDLHLIVLQPAIDTRTAPGFFGAWQTLATFNGERGMVRTAEASMVAKRFQRPRAQVEAPADAGASSEDFTSSGDSPS